MIPANAMKRFCFGVLERLEGHLLLLAILGIMFNIYLAADVQIDAVVIDAAEPAYAAQQAIARAFWGDFKTAYFLP